MSPQVVHRAGGPHGGIAWGGARVLIGVIAPLRGPDVRYGKPIEDLGRNEGTAEPGSGSPVHESVSMGIPVSCRGCGQLGIRSCRSKPYMWGLMNRRATRYCVWARRRAGSVAALSAFEVFTPPTGECCGTPASTPQRGLLPPLEVLPCA